MITFYKRIATGLLFTASLISQDTFAQRPLPVISEITNITSTQAIVYWYPVQDAVSYIVRRYPKGTTDYTYYIPAVTDTFRKLVNMVPETHYSAQVKAIFPGVGDSSDWSAPKNFHTIAGCNPPSELKAKKITDSSVKFRWTPPLTPVLKYDIRYRLLGSSTWTDETKGPNEILLIITGLAANNTYEWQMRSKCDLDISTWVSGPLFTTASGFLAAESGTIGFSITSVKITAQISPNPNRGNFTIQAQLPEKKASTVLVIYNMQGAKIWQKDAGKTGGKIYSEVSLENNLISGIYTLVIFRDDTMLVQKIIISK